MWFVYRQNLIGCASSRIQVLMSSSSASQSYVLRRWPASLIAGSPNSTPTVRPPFPSSSSEHRRTSAQPLLLTPTPAWDGESPSPTRCRRLGKSMEWRRRRGSALTATWNAQRWAVKDSLTCSSKQPKRHWTPPRPDVVNDDRQVAAGRRCSSTPHHHWSAGEQTKFKDVISDRSVI